MESSKTPVLIVAPGVRVVVSNDCPPDQMFLIDGETYCVNGEYPYSAVRVTNVPKDAV